MLEAIPSPAQATYWFVSGSTLFWTMHILGLGCFAYIVTKRLTPLVQAEKDFRLDRPTDRLGRVLKFWFAQWKHPRYRTAGIMHILIFAGFIILAIHTFVLLGLGTSGVGIGASESGVRHSYDLITNYAATVVFLCMIFAAVRRLVFKPTRYNVPARYGKAHTADAIFLLSLIALLMFAESVFEASKVALLARQGSSLVDYFTFEEQELVSKIPSAAQPLAASLVWSAKESVLKALHVGLRADTRSVAVDTSLQNIAAAKDCDWHPLLIPCDGATPLHGWWRCERNVLRTVVSDADHEPPLTLAARHPSTFLRVGRLKRQ